MELFLSLDIACDNDLDLEASLSVFHRRSIHHDRPEAIVGFSPANRQCDIQRNEDLD